MLTSGVEEAGDRRGRTGSEEAAEKLTEIVDGAGVVVVPGCSSWHDEEEGSVVVRFPQTWSPGEYPGGGETAGVRC